MPLAPVARLARRTPCLLTVALLGACSSPDAVPGDAWHANVEMFDAELQDLQTALGIPGLAYVIVADSGPVASRAFGTAQPPDSAPFTTSTPRRIASITKSLTAIVALQLVEEGRLDLDAPARQYASELSVPQEVRVRHLLSHTSEGTIGTGYIYSSTRYAMLGRIIEAAAETTFATAVGCRILDRAGMPPFPSPDLGAHAALVSTVEQMGKYLTALEQGALLPSDVVNRLAVPSRAGNGLPLPTSLGWFAQSVQGQQVMWSFGQDDPEHSGALLIRLPERQLSLFVLANSNVLSDPFRLLMGDATKSPFAMSFLRLFAFSSPGAPLRRPTRTDAQLASALDAAESRAVYRYRDELVGWALIDLWTNDLANAQRKFDLVRNRYRDSTPDAVLHFATARLGDDSARRGAILDGERLLRAQPENRWILLAQGALLQQDGRTADASNTFRRILALPNQESDFLGRLFRAWSWMALAQMAAPSNPDEARAYLRNIMQSGVTGGTLDDATRMLDSLDRVSVRRSSSRGGVP